VKAQDWLLRSSMHFNMRWGYSLDEASVRAKMLLQSRGGKTSESPEVDVDNYMNGDEQNSTYDPVSGINESDELHSGLPHSKAPEGDRSKLLGNNYVQVSTSEPPVLTDAVEDVDEDRLQEKPKQRRTAKQKAYKRTLHARNRVALFMIVAVCGLLLWWFWPTGGNVTDDKAVAQQPAPARQEAVRQAKSSDSVTNLAKNTTKKKSNTTASVSTSGTSDVNKTDGVLAKSTLVPVKRPGSALKQKRYSFFLKNGRFYSTTDLEAARLRYRTEFGREFPVR